MRDLRRRQFLTLLAGTAAAWPLAARAQQPPMPVVGFLSGGSPGAYAAQLAAFHLGLKALGYVEGDNVAIEYRWADGAYDRLPTLAADLVRRRVAVIAATGGHLSGLAAKATTSSIPIVFNAGEDPVTLGLVTSINRPGGNATGVYVFLVEMDAKRMELLRELVPNPALIAVLLNPNQTRFKTVSKEVAEAARAAGQRIDLVEASNESEIYSAFNRIEQLRPQALLVGADPFFNARREQLVTLANHYAIPAIYELREFAAAGGLMSYGTSLTEAYRQIGLYTGRILKGEKPAELPVVQSTKFELVINLKTAKALRLEIPPMLLARADEVIE
jgi:putative tryptophan/tyrosine transport system substrate-binding protein